VFEYELCDHQGYLSAGDTAPHIYRIAPDYQQRSAFHQLASDRKLNTYFNLPDEYKQYQPCYFYYHGYDHSGYRQGIFFQPAKYYSAGRNDNYLDKQWLGRTYCVK
jgi:hypothetical protein